MDLHANLIDGEWVEGEAVPNLNPANTAEVVGDYARATAEDAERAIAAAKAAFPVWSPIEQKFSAQQRRDHRKATQILHCGDPGSCRTTFVGLRLEPLSPQPCPEFHIDQPAGTR